MATVVANGTYRVGMKGNRRGILIKKGKVYNEKDAVVKARPELFDKPDEAAARQSRPTSTAELGQKSASGVRTRRQKPGQPTSEPKGDD